MAARVIRVFSDLHFRDAESHLQTLASLAPLFEGADEVILNGDTLDTQSAATRDHLPEVRAFFAATVARTTFISGNHDPDISPLGEHTLHSGRVWITHGDVLFDDIVPWGGLRGELVRRLTALSLDLSPPELARIETRLRLHRLACHALPERHDISSRDLLRRLRRITRALLPPRQALAMLRAWRDTPRLADELASRHRPDARLVLVGHTHYPGVWRRPGGRVVVNTGSFSRFWGGHLVELQDELVKVRRIEKRAGEFLPGRTLAEFPLAD
jgi:predicted phosphodiesterase